MMGWVWVRGFQGKAALGRQLPSPLYVTFLTVSAGHPLGICRNLWVLPGRFLSGEFCGLTTNKWVLRL